MKIYNYSSVSAEKRISAIVNRGLAFKKKIFSKLHVSSKKSEDTVTRHS